MTPLILSEEHVPTNLQRRDSVRDFIQARVQTVGYEPSDDEVLEHLNL